MMWALVVVWTGSAMTVIQHGAPIYPSESACQARAAFEQRWHAPKAPETFAAHCEVKAVLITAKVSHGKAHKG